MYIISHEDSTESPELPAMSEAEWTKDNLYNPYNLEAGEWFTQIKNACRTDRQGFAQILKYEN